VWYRLGRKGVLLARRVAARRARAQTTAVAAEAEAAA
jgi:hypothetical protein